MKILQVIRADFARWFLKKNFFFCFFDIFLLNYMILFQNVEEFRNSTIVNLVFYYMNDTFFIINFMIAAVLMGTSYCDEKENGYYRFWIYRCNEKLYICSKIINCFLCAFVLLFAAMFLWILSLRIFMPWADTTSDQFFIAAEQGMGTLLRQEHFFTYYALYCVGIGMLAGILSVGTFTISLFISNRMLAVLFVALLFYMDVAYLGSLFPLMERWNLEQILFFPFSRISSVEITILRGFLYTLIMIVFFALIAYWHLRKEKKYD